MPLRRVLPTAALLLALAAAPAHAEVRADGPAGRVIPESFAGLSVETDVLPTWFRPGSCQSPIREVLRMAGRPEIRIGGNSQDRLRPSGPVPSGQKQIADTSFFHAVRCAGATGSPILLGLNLLARDAKATGDLLAAAGGLVPRGQLAITVGNEPNLYGSRLPAPGGYEGYLALQGNTIRALRARFGSFLPPIVGPSPAAYRWAPETARFIRELRPAEGDAHLYGLNGCAASKGDAPQPTVAQLLSSAATEDVVEPLTQIVAAADAIGTRAQISEINSVACRGTTGVSDSPASALWALRTIGDLVQAGFSRAQFHTSYGDYDPFVLDADGSVGFRPLWTSILLADALWPQRSRSFALRGALPDGLNAYAARRPGGSLAVLAVNSDLTHARRLVLRTPARRARIGRLVGRGAFAVSLNGRRLAWRDGEPVWTGRQRVRTLRAHGGRLRATLAPGTAAWLVLDPQRTAAGPERLTR